MAANGYPKLTVKAWNALRSRAAAAPSNKFTPAAVAALMNMSSPNSARDNTVNPMKRLGLIDDDGALTQRGNKWRVDASFADACQEILDDVYPDELDSLVDADGNPDATKIKTWFDHKGFGNSSARQMAATYVMVASKRIPEAPTTSGESKKKPAPKKQPAPRASAEKDEAKERSKNSGANPPAPRRLPTTDPMFTLTSRSISPLMPPRSRSTRSFRAWRGISTRSDGRAVGRAGGAGAQVCRRAGGFPPPT